MNFLAPYMLWGAAAVGIPIAIHFFFRSRYRTIPWAAMKFLLTSIEQTSRRLRFQELLLLAARCVLLGLLALAMARPITSLVRGSGRGDAVDAVMLFDISYGMGAKEGADSRLQLAQKAATKLIEKLPPHSTVQIVVCSNRAQTIGPRNAGNLDQAAVLVKELQVESLASDLYPGMAEARAILERGSAPNKELYVFSDMQKLAFDQQSANVVKELQEMKSKAAIHFVRCGSATPPKNVAILGIVPQSGVPRPGERLGFAVLLKNTGADEVQNLRVSLSIDNDEKNTESFLLEKIPAGDTRAVTMTGKIEKAGLRLLTATIHGDQLEGDNRLDQVISVQEQVNVLVLDGALDAKDPERSSSYFLNHALAPVRETERAKHVVQVKTISPRLASPALLAKSDLVVFANVAIAEDAKNLRDAKGLRLETPPSDFLEELAKVVRKGKGLVIFGGDNVRAAAYNKVLGTQLGLLPMPIEGVRKIDASKKEEPLHFQRASFELPAFRPLREDKFFETMNDVAVFQTLDFAEVKDKKKAKPVEVAEGQSVDEKPADETPKADPTTVVLRYSNGKPAIVSRKVDWGETMIVGIAAEPGIDAKSPEFTWSELPLHPSFIPFVQRLTTHLLQAQSQNHNLTAGDALRWYPSLKEVRFYTLLTPDEQFVRLGQPETVGQRPVVTAKDLTRAGLYRLGAKAPSEADMDTESEKDEIRKKGIPFGVSADLRETQDLEILNENQINTRLGFSPIHLTAEGGENAVAGIERVSREWTLWALAAVLILAIGEALLAWFCGRAW
ncbi:MAG: BatA domain-containing protein [Gemmataceae bacterium]|nr:BatA domain-containing protein [Gemmataceae bacterium]